jgi:hypothetical protein
LAGVPWCKFSPVTLKNMVSEFSKACI